MGKSQKVVSQDVPYGNASYNTPFGSWSNSGQSFTSTLSPAQQNQLDLSQSQLYDIFKQLPTDGPMGSASMNNYNNPNSYLGAYNKTYRDVMDQQYGVPLRQKNAGQYGGDSTIGRYAENDLNTKIGNQGILNSGNLATSNYNSMLQGANAYEGDINNIYNRMIGQANQGLGQQNSYLSNAQQNANRAYQASAANTAAANNRQQAMWNSLADLGLLAAAPFTGGASMLMMNPFGGATNNPTSQGSTGGGSPYGMYGDYVSSMFGGNTTNPNTYDANYGQAQNSMYGQADPFASQLNGGLNAYTAGMVDQGGNPTGQIDASYGSGYGPSQSPQTSYTLDQLLAMFSQRGR